MSGAAEMAKMLSLSRVAGAASALLAATACGSGSSSRRHPPVIARSALCLAEDERKALECSGGTASRSGDTLRIRLTSPAAAAFVNTGGEDDAVYQYRGRLGPGGFHLVERIGGEHPPYYLLVHPRSGVVVTAVAPPIVSPDSTRFAAAIPAWDCAESPDQRLEIWRFAEPIPEREWTIAGLQCEAHGAMSGWAAIEPVWRSPDTLVFVRVEQPSQRRREAVVVRDGRAWRVVDTR